MRKKLKTIVLQYDVYADLHEVVWNPVAVLNDPQDLYPLIEDWEKKIRAEVKWSTTPNEFSIGDNARYKVTYAYEWTP
jgi:hypothetical protein